jgi:hypothetical protein
MVYTAVQTEDEMGITVQTKRRVDRRPCGDCDRRLVQSPDDRDVCDGSRHNVQALTTSSVSLEEGTSLSPERVWRVGDSTTFATTSKKHEFQFK